MKKNKIREQEHRVIITNSAGLWLGTCTEKCGWKRSHSYYYELLPIVDAHYKKHEPN